MYGRGPPGFLASAIFITPGILAFWLLFFPVPYHLLLAATAVCPLLAIPLLLIWRDTFVVGFGSTEPLKRSETLGPLWLFPPAPLAWRVFFDLEWAYSPWSFVAGLAVGVGYGGLLALLDRNIRGPALAALIAIASVWGWSSLMLINAGFDRTPGRIQPAEVIAKDRESESLDVSIPGDRLRSRTLLATRSAYWVASVGGQVCVDDNPGLFGWRMFWLTPCDGLLRTLPGAKPPGPPAPSPPR